ncbi:hypothetical protein ACFVJK_46345 [Streptomyces sp. NPDC127172]|uniref:hypothetical protein n=1 Tax=Streptomyces sp. NPDC127172 TaxID=3345382 RepID=UPI0036324F3E
MSDLPIAARIALATFGQLTWWYLFHCLTDTWGGQVARSNDGAGSVAVPWLIFSVIFYVHGLLLGYAWRHCQAQPTGYSLTHVLVSSALVASAATLTWGMLIRFNAGAEFRASRRPAPAVLGAVVMGALLLWPAIAVWHAVAVSTGSPCVPETVLPWWPSWLPA